MDGMLLVDFRRRATSALMHPVTLAALGVLLVNDLLFKALWPGAWIPGKLSDLAWMVFAPPLLAYILSFATPGNGRGQRAAFAAAYLGLPLLYAAFNTFAPVHDVILRGLGLFGGDGPRSPLDPTDSIVIPLAMAAALWVWRRPPLEPESIRARIALLSATAAAMASVATSYDSEWGARQVGRTPSGALGVNTDWAGGYQSVDGGFTWMKASENFVPLERQEWRELEVKSPEGDVFIEDGSHPQIIRERSERELSEREWMDLTSPFWAPDHHSTVFGASASREVVYSYEHLRTGGNRWMQALDKRDVEDRVIATRATDLFFDNRSGNLIVGMGLQGVVVVAPDGTSTQVTVGPFSPTDFSFDNKVRTLFGSLLHRDTVVFTAIALVLAFSCATLALAVSIVRVTARTWLALISVLLAAPLLMFAIVAPSLFYGLSVPFSDFGGLFLFLALYGVIVGVVCLKVSAARRTLLPWLAVGNSVFLALSLSVYPHVSPYPWEGRLLGYVALVLSGWGLAPFAMAAVGLALVRPSRRELLAVSVAIVVMLMLMGLSALVLFEAGVWTANFVAVGLVGLATVGLSIYLKCTRSGGFSFLPHRRNPESPDPLLR